MKKLVCNWFQWKWRGSFLGERKKLRSLKKDLENYKRKKILKTVKIKSLNLELRED
jgi:hypothetical protein